MAQVINSPKSFGDRLQAVPKPILYAILIAFAAIPLFFTDVVVPNKPVEPSVDFYAQLMQIPDGSRVLIGSDVTNSTRGESLGELECLFRILMRKNVKFAIYSTGDPQAPQVARDVVARISQENAKEGGAAYKPFADYVSLGYFPNSEGTLTAINTNVVAAFAGKKDLPAGGVPTDVFQSPVFKGVRQVSDFQMLVLITASSTNTLTLERIDKLPLMFMVTGVMVPENQTYYASGQLKGLVGGVKGVYDLEQLMESGVNNDGPGKISSNKYEKIPGWAGKTNKGKGTAYYLSLHFCLLLLILAVFAGNLGMFLAKRRAA